MRLNRLHFYKRFDPAHEFVAIKTFLYGGKDYVAGEPFDKADYPAHKIKRLFDARKIAPVERDFVPRRVKPEIRKAGPVWRKVFVGDEQIGKTVKSDEEANEIIENYLNGNS